MPPPQQRTWRANAGDRHEPEEEDDYTEEEEEEEEPPQTDPVVPSSPGRAPPQQQRVATKSQPPLPPPAAPERAPSGKTKEERKKEKKERARREKKEQKEAKKARKEDRAEAHEGRKAPEQKGAQAAQDGAPTREPLPRVHSVAAAKAKRDAALATTAAKARPPSNDTADGEPPLTPRARAAGHNPYEDDLYDGDPSAGGSAQGSQATQLTPPGPPPVVPGLGDGTWVWIAQPAGHSYWFFAPATTPTSRGSERPRTPPRGPERPPAATRGRPPCDWRDYDGDDSRDSRDSRRNQRGRSTRRAPPRTRQRSPTPRRDAERPPRAPKGKSQKGKGAKGRGKKGKKERVSGKGTGGDYKRRNRPGLAQRRRRREAQERAAGPPRRPRAKEEPRDDAPVKEEAAEGDERPPADRRGGHRHDNDEPNDEGDDEDDEEQAESEPATTDPIVDLTPSELGERPSTPSGKAASTGRPCKPPSASGRSSRPRSGPAPLSPLAPGLGSPARLSNRTPSALGLSGSAKTWDPRSGPAPGVRWKSGAPPVPPRYAAEAKEVGTFDRYARRVRLWAKRASGWMTDGDAALLLVESLTGAAERELEFVELATLEAEGVEGVLKRLEAASNEQLVYRKHHYLRGWEQVRRLGGESMRTYVRRFDQLHKQLAHVGVDVAAMYSGEALGHRLLERSGLSSEQARMVLIGSSQSFEYAPIRDSLLLQYPDTLPVPPIASGPGSGKGKPKGDKNRSQKVHVTTHDEDDHQSPEAPDQSHPDVDELTSALEVLTVTAQKLKAFTQGRRWSDGKGSPTSPSKRPPATGKPSYHHGKGKGKGDKGKASKGKGPSKVHVAENLEEEGADHGDHEDAEWHDPNEAPEVTEGDEGEGDYGQDDTYESFFVWMTNWEGQADEHPTTVPPHVSQVLASAPDTAAGLMVVDTACQKTCIGRRAYLAHCEVLRQFGLRCSWTPESEYFKFGAGPPKRSSMSLAIPAAIEGKAMVLIASLLETSIPLLASLRLLKQLGMVLDLTKQCCHLSTLGVTVPLSVTLGGHLALRVTDFKEEMPRSADTWHTKRKQGEEVVVDPALVPACDHECGVDCHASVWTAAVGSSTVSATTPSSPLTALSDARTGPRSTTASELVGLMAPSPGGAHDHAPPLRADGPTMPPAEHRPHPVPGGVSHSGGGHTRQLHAPTHAHKAARERNRQVRRVPLVRSPLEVGRRPRWLGIVSTIVWAFYVALTYGSNYLGTDGFDGNQFQGQGQEYPFYQEAGYTEVPPPDPTRSRGVRPGEPGERTDWDELRPVPSRERRGVLRLGPGPELKKGQMKQLASQARKAHRALTLEQATLQRELIRAADVRRRVVYGRDLLQITTCESGQNMKAMGLNTVEPSWDIGVPKGRKALTEAFDYHRPLVAAARLTSSTAHTRPETVEAVLKLLKKQQRRGYYWTLIAPRDHPVWSIKGMGQHLEQSHAHVAEADERIASNHEWLARPNPDATPAGLAERVRRVVREIEPTRFHQEKDELPLTPACGMWDRVSTKPPFHETYYLDYQQDEREWRTVMGQVEQVFRTSATLQITLIPDHDIRRRVEELFPWDVGRVQLAKSPKARRFPRDIPFTHRGTILLYNDDELVCESEDVANIAFPRQRFAKPVRYAICVYGNAPEDPSDVPAPPAATGPPVADPEVPPEEVHGADVTFPGCQAPREIKRAVARLHVNLGHPSAADTVRMLAQSGSVTPEAISAAKALSCASCLRLKGNTPARPSRLIDRFVGQLGDSMQMDIFYSRTVDGTNYPLLGMVDEATNLQQVCVLKDRNPKTIIEAFRTTWVRPFGFPHKITLDQDGAFMGDFWTYLIDNSTEVDYIPPEAHHRLGKAERCNAVYREVLNRVVDSMAAATREDLEKAVDATTHAINTMPRTRGLSAYAIVFGRIPRVPGELLTDDASLAAHIPLEEHNRHTIVYRAEAQKAAAQVNVDQHVRRALLRKTARMRVDDITPGAKCAVWRSQLRGKGPRKRGGYIIGRLVTFDGHCTWVQLGTQTVKVDRNQLRPAYGFEAWSPTDEDIRALKDAERNFLSGQVEDYQNEGPPEDEPLVPELEFPTSPGSPEQFSALDAPPASVPGIPVPPEKVRRTSASSDAPPLPPPAEPPPQAMDTDTASQGTKRTAEAQSGRTTPSKRSARPSFSSNLVCEHDEIFLRPPGWDGSDWQPDHPERLSALPQVFASEHAAPAIPCPVEEGIEDCHSSWQVCYVGDQRKLANVEKLTRKELKALNREVPWRDIVRQGGIVFDKYVESARREHEQWESWAPIRPLSDEEATAVMRDPLLRTRILKSRACYRDKAQGQGDLQAKTRVVVLGHRDPDLHHISRDAPTPTRLTESILLSVYISGRNRKFLKNGRRWKLWCADATTAFLQGSQDEGERPHKLYMMSPRDPILAKAGAFPATLYEVTGSVYGLANAPRLWSLEVGKRLLNAGFRPHALDRMCFLHYDPQGCLDCIALVYVDDFLVTYADTFKLDVLTSLFRWGRTSSDEDVITFKGKQLRTVKENGVYVLRVTQTEYIRSLIPGKITRQRSRENPKLTESELSEFRSCCGALQWLVGQTRPDGAACVSLTNRQRLQPGRVEAALWLDGVLQTYRRRRPHLPRHSAQRGDGHSHIWRLLMGKCRRL